MRKLLGISIVIGGFFSSKYFEPLMPGYIFIAICILAGLAIFFFPLARNEKLKPASDIIEFP